VRTSETPPSADTNRSWPLPDDVGANPVMRGQTAGETIETRLASGSMREAGPGSYWARINGDLVAGETTTPMTRVAMAADIASGPSSIVDGRAWSFANLDLSIYLTRAPVDEWIFADCETTSVGDGTAIMQARLGDRVGRIGVANQVLYIAPRATS
jgi:hypothetical protein